MPGDYINPIPSDEKRISAGTAEDPHVYGDDAVRSFKINYDGESIRVLPKSWYTDEYGNVMYNVMTLTRTHNPDKFPGVISERETQGLEPYSATNPKPSAEVALPETKKVPHFDREIGQPEPHDDDIQVLIPRGEGGVNGYALMYLARERAPDGRAIFYTLDKDEDDEEFVSSHKHGDISAVSENIQAEFRADQAAQAARKVVEGAESVEQQTAPEKFDEAEAAQEVGAEATKDAPVEISLHGQHIEPQEESGVPAHEAPMVVPAEKETVVAPEPEPVVGVQPQSKPEVSPKKESELNRKFQTALANIESDTRRVDRAVESLKQLSDYAKELDRIAELLENREWDSNSANNRLTAMKKEIEDFIASGVRDAAHTKIEKVMTESIQLKTLLEDARAVISFDGTPEEQAQRDALAAGIEKLDGFLVEARSQEGKISEKLKGLHANTIELEELVQRASTGVLSPDDLRRVATSTRTFVGGPPVESTTSKLNDRFKSVHFK